MTTQLLQICTNCGRRNSTLTMQRIGPTKWRCILSCKPGPESLYDNPPTANEIEDLLLAVKRGKTVSSLTEREQSIILGVMTILK